LRLSVTGVTLYSGGSSVSFMVSGIRFRKDGTLGKLQETLNLSFTDESMPDESRLLNRTGMNERHSNR
jgi:hypothetical protein